MKFRKVTFKDHPVFGSICFDFTDASGKTVDTIILAGENGCGKSLLLSFLNSYNPNSTAKNLGFTLRVEMELTNEDLAILQKDKLFLNSFGADFTGNIVTFIHDTVFKDDNSRVEYKTKSGGKALGYAFQFATNSNLYKSVLSDVEINFTSNSISHTTSKNIDNPVVHSERSSHNLATEIKQLLVDINELDNDELGRWVDKHRGIAPDDSILHKRIRRFTNAFDKMFPHKRFVGIDNKDGNKIVLFEEFDRQMELDQLSSGEKQIVFRGGYLLRNLGTINGATVLVDEPELSLHPTWQLKILNFLKSLFTDETGKQTSQLIIATHSPFILHNSTRANDKVLVMQKSDDGALQVLDKPEYYNWSEASVVEEAFNVLPLLSDRKVTVFLEGETDETYFNKAMEVFGYDASKLSFNWIGHYASGNKGKAENTGDKALNNAASFFKANPQMIQNTKVYLLYDCDTNKPYEQQGNLYVGSMTKNVQATSYEKGVENLLILPIDFDYDKFYKTSTKKDEYGALSTIVTLDKISLASYVVSLPREQLVDILKNLKTEIDTILKKSCDNT